MPANAGSLSHCGPDTLPLANPTSPIAYVKPSILSLLVFASALACAGAVSTQAEFALARAGAGSDSAFFAAAGAEGFPAPGSISGTNLILRRCSEVVAGLMGALQPAEFAAPARTNCRRFAEAALFEMPTNGLAALLGARLAFLEGDTESGNAFLERSQMVAAHEQWLAEARVAIAEDNLEHLTEAVRRRHEADLVLLARSARGVRSIAYRYVSDPAFRERITAIVETLPGDVQQRFLNNVRRSANAFGFSGGAT